MKSTLLFATCLTLGIVMFRCSPQQDKPNVLILYADDLGWSDLGSYGNLKNETPNLDGLAAEGVRFTNAYSSAPICSASRASILTGKSPARLNFEFVSTEGKTTDKPLLPPERTLDLPLEEITIGALHFSVSGILQNTMKIT